MKCEKGEWLKENISQGGDHKSNSMVSSLKLKDVNISYDESSKAQRIANIWTSVWRSTFLFMVGFLFCYVIIFLYLQYMRWSGG